MKLAAFETIAKPHRDILRGNFTPDTYAAKLGQVVKKEGPLEYRSAQQFFQKTYMTEGLKALLSGVEGRLKGRERRNQDPIIQLQTPFGGGKTHTLIALYHKAREWNATPVVIVGSEMDPGDGDTFWGQIEGQLTGNILQRNKRVAPGSNSISELFKRSNKPAMILMDEVLNYLTRAAAVRVEKSTLADQTIAFMLSLTEAVASSPNVVFIVTLQASEVQPLADRFPLFKDLLNRMKRMVTPVEDGEIASIIRSRLFSKDNFNHNEVKKVVREFTKYAKKEGILPEGDQESEYRGRFIESYPFQPEVVDVLYKRWGSFPDFQRTRGVLRLLSHVVHRACSKNRPYITLADFDLSDTDIREELLEHIDKQYRSVIASDITGHNAGAKVVDKALGSAYKGLALGTRTATAIFLYSFTGGVERGASLDEIKRSTALTDQPAAIIDSAKNQLSQHLFYLRAENGISYFDTQPNLRRIVQTRMDNIDEAVVEGRVSTQLRKSFKSSGYLKTYIAPKDGTDIRDTDDLKLVVLSKRDDTFCQNLVENHGETPRIYRNTLFFIIPSEGEANRLKVEVKSVIAHEEIKKDSSLNLSATQRKEINDTLKYSESALENAVRQDYRIVLIPTKDGFSEEDLGLPAAGMNTPFDETVYEMLRVKSEILTSIGPRNILLRYLKDNDIVSTSQLFHSSLRSPGETRVLRDAWVAGIRQGIQEETPLFALGKKGRRKLIPYYFKTDPREIHLDDDEVIIQPNLIRESITAEEILHDYLKENETISTSLPFQYNPQSANEPRPLSDVWESAIREGVQKGTFGIGDNIDDETVLRAFRQEVSTITLSDNEVLIHPSLCTKLIVEPPRPDPLDGSEGIDIPDDDTDDSLSDGESKKTISIRFRLPQGKVSNVAQHLNKLQSKFQNMQLELKASNGEISQEAYEELKENLRVLGIETEET
jgi:hypothetical protein